MGGFQPSGWRTVTPRIFTDDVRGLTAFMRAVFGATGRVVAGRPVEMQIGDSIVLVSSDDVREAMAKCVSRAEMRSTLKTAGVNLPANLAGGD